MAESNWSNYSNSNNYIVNYGNKLVHGVLDDITKMQSNESKYNLSYWAFIYLIRTSPYKYLSKEGKIIFNLSVKKKYESFTKLSKDISEKNTIVSKLCKNLCDEGHISIKSVKNKKEIIFNKEILKEAEKLVKGPEI